MKYVLVGTMYGLMKGLYWLNKRNYDTDNVFISAILCIIIAVYSIVGLCIMLVEAIVAFILMFLLGQRVYFDECKQYDSVVDLMDKINNKEFGLEEETEETEDKDYERGKKIIEEELYEETGYLNSEES